MDKDIDHFLSCIHGSYMVCYYDDLGIVQCWNGSRTVNVYNAFSLKEITCWTSANLTFDNIKGEMDEWSGTLTD